MCCLDGFLTVSLISFTSLKVGPARDIRIENRILDGILHLKRKSAFVNPRNNSLNLSLDEIEPLLLRIKQED